MAFIVKHNNFVYIIFLITFCIESIHLVCGSLGDSFPDYRSCNEKCTANLCDRDEHHFNIQGNSLFSVGLFKWSCIDDCRYQCMWPIVDMFERKGWSPPQFHGKWPFIRIMGLQEPASVVFSIMNLFVHLVMFKRFRKEVRPNSPMYIVWFIFFAICCNCWFWSAIFHSRDRPISEMMDYLSAFGMVFYTLYGLIMRILVHAPLVFPVLFSLTCISFYVNHALYLALEKFDYHYNMNANIIVGVSSSTISVFWCMCNRRLPQSKHLLTVVMIGLATTILELADFPPIGRVLDAHALWHFSTVPIPYFFWKFAIEDCRYLYSTSKLR